MARDDNDDPEGYASFRNHLFLGGYRASSARRSRSDFPGRDYRHIKAIAYPFVSTRRREGGVRALPRGRPFHGIARSPREEGHGNTSTTTSPAASRSATGQAEKGAGVGGLGFTAARDATPSALVTTLGTDTEDRRTSLSSRDLGHGDGVIARTSSRSWVRDWPDILPAVAPTRTREKRSRTPATITKSSALGFSPTPAVSSHRH